MYVFTNLSTTGSVWHKVNFYVECNWFEFKVFLLNLLLNQVLSGQFALIFLPIVEFISFPKVLVLYEISM